MGEARRTWPLPRPGIILAVYCPLGEALAGLPSTRPDTRPDGGPLGRIFQSGWVLVSHKIQDDPPLPIQTQMGVELGATAIAETRDNSSATGGNEAVDLGRGQQAPGDLLPDHEVAAFPIAVATKAPAALDDATHSALGTGQVPQGDP